MDKNPGRNADYKYGTLPSPAPLAVSYVPMQEEINASQSIQLCDAFSM